MAFPAVPDFASSVFSDLEQRGRLRKETGDDVLSQMSGDGSAAMRALLERRLVSYAELYEAAYCQKSCEERDAWLKVARADALPETPFVLNDRNGILGADHRDCDIIVVSHTDAKDSGGPAASDRTCFVLTAASQDGDLFRDCVARVITGGWRIRAVLTLTSSALTSIVWSRWDDRNGVSRGRTAVVASNQQQLFRDIGHEAYRMGASDIHIVARRGVGHVLYRIDGDVIEQSKYQLTQDEAVSLVSATYDTKTEKASVKSGFNKQSLQDGSIEEQYSDCQLRFRYLGHPVEPDGLRAVLRIIPIMAEQRSRSIASLGYAPGAAEKIRRAFARSSGMVLFLGTTGSGKSTTLAVGLSNLIRERPTKAVVTVEEPVEYIIPGAYQVAVKRQTGEDGQNAFQRTLRAIMRADPDVLMQGEIRDLETADMALQGVRSGHLLLSTLHAGSAPTAYDRLAGLGIKRVDLATVDLVAALVFQVLVQTLCEHCRIPARDFKAARDPATKGVVRRLHTALERRVVPGASEQDDGLDGIYFRHPQGCEHCQHRGITGRTVCAEVLQPSREMLPFIAKGDSVGLWDAWRAQVNPDDPDDMTGRRAIEHAMWKMAHGITAPDEVERQFRSLDELIYGG